MKVKTLAMMAGLGGSLLLGGIAGNAANPLMITSSMGDFFQEKSLGANNIEPNAGLFGAFPDLEYDTYVTIGNKTLDPLSPTQLSPGFTSGQGFSGGTLFLDDGSWFRTPDDPATIIGDDGRIIIGQFTIPAGARLDGIVRIAGFFDGDPTDLIGQTFNFSTAVPAPGALALLGLAGLAGGRRRRRA
jgi:MYXO-CTERM domain-containing protein